jgi:hypothetical protein
MEWISDYRKAIGGSAILSGLIVMVIQLVQGEVLVGSIVLAAVVVAAALLVWWTRPSGGRYDLKLWIGDLFESAAYLPR